MADNDVLRRDGVLVRITGFDDERTAYFGVMPNGHTTQLTFPRQEVFDVGDVLLVGTDFYRKVPHDVWPLKPRVGIVRRALNEGVVLETSDGLELLEGDYPTSIMPGNTVQFTDLFGIERVLWPTAIRPGESDHDDDIKQYRITPGSDPSLTFDSFGGYEQVITRAKELIETQLGNSAQMRAIGAKPIKGVIFTGAPGTGKTHLARIIANVADAQFYLVSGPTIVSKYVGDSEETLRMIFAAAQADKRAIIFFDEIDSIASSRENDTNGVGKRLVAQLLTLMMVSSPRAMWWWSPRPTVLRTWIPLCCVRAVSTGRFLSRCRPSATVWEFCRCRPVRCQSRANCRWPISHSGPKAGAVPKYAPSGPRPLWWPPRTAAARSAPTTSSPRSSESNVDPN